jgi:cyclophilin family peptidyl-prolyl cis-trans isomerase/HEAT repeat protein
MSSLRAERLRCVCLSWFVFVFSVVVPVAAQPLPEQIVAAEDARVSTPAQMAPIRTGLKTSDPRIVRQAVRALGRFERPELVPDILPLVKHGRAEVRAEALNALGQALARVPRGIDEKAPLPAEANVVRNALAAHVRADLDPYATGVAAETLGRLPYRAAEEIAETERLLTSVLPAASGNGRVVPGEPIARVVQPAAVMGAVKGLETLIRVYQKLHPPSEPTLARLRGTATLGSDPSDGDLAYIRRVAWLALNAVGAADAALVAQGLEDPDAQVRRLAVLALLNGRNVEAERPALLGRALRDASFIVRYDAIRVYNRTLQEQDCAPVLAAVDDPNPHVALAAIDALAAHCPAAQPRLVTLSDTLSESATDWHRPAHAFVALARSGMNQNAVASRLPTFAEHPVWQVRMYSTRAASAIGATARLERLARDAHDNVREAALQGLIAVQAHEADDLYIEQLDRPDYQLVLSAANALEGSPNADRAVPALLAAFNRITAEKKDTSRDTRMALLDRIEELGTKAHGTALKNCAADFDPNVATRCAGMLAKWTGATPVIKTADRKADAVPSVAANRMRVTMRRGGSFDVRLFADEAPATVARVVRLATDGYYNGLTFHRVVPNFVIQGGSPGANEYVGDGPFMRDELGLRSHARGTLGISTRGRDTGDAQIFINLVDNVRLDHNYTVFAEVTAGLDVVDGILEGDVIDRIDVLATTSSKSGR